MCEVLLVGNPNAGKTTLFNSLAMADEHVGNWHGVTVETKEKVVKLCGKEVKIVDTPGIYSLNALSFEEEVSINTILKNKDKKIINICDQNTLKRSLYLTLCLLEQGCDVVVAINQTTKKIYNKVDLQKMSQLLSVDIVEINPQKQQGLKELCERLFLTKKRANLPYFDKKLSKTDLNLVKERYKFVDFLIDSATKQTEFVYGQSKIDKVLLNKYLAIPIFFVMMAVVFYLTFFLIGGNLSKLFTETLQVVVSPISEFLENKFYGSWVCDLFSVAVIGGFATVLSFLPQVVLLFFFLTVLEESGYMARVAFVFEDLLSKVGLSGKSIYTVLMGFGCSTSAIMTARTMDDKNAKIKTALLCPYMSCSAKIPIYTVIGSAFFGAKNLWCIMGLYLLGIVVAIVVCKIYDKTILKSDKQTFILEFPSYRSLSAKKVAKTLLKNAKHFVVKVGSVMVATNVIVWVLSSFSFSFRYVALGGESMLEWFGKILSPIFSPLGFDNWAIASALLAGVVAKEVVVSSIAMFNGIDVSATGLISQSLLLSSSVVHFSGKSAVLSFLVFCLLYVPCLSSIAMLREEVGKKWTLIAIAVQIFVAYAVSFVIYNISFAVEIFGFFAVFAVILSFFCIFCAIFVLKKRLKKRFCGKNCDNCGKCKR